MNLLSRRTAIRLLMALVPLGWLLRSQTAAAQAPVLQRREIVEPARRDATIPTSARILRADGLKPEDDAAHGWDWLDNAWWLSFAPMLTNPFESANQLGVPVTPANCRPQDGWVLYTRRILTTDAQPVPQPGVSGVPLGADRMFALYNGYSGVLRIFFHVTRPAALNMRFLVSFYGTRSGAANPTATHAYLALMGSHAQDALNATYRSENRVLQYIESATEGWIVSDLMLGYSAVTRSDPLYLTWEVASLATAVLSLRGRTEVRVPAVQTSQSWLTRIVSIGANVVAAVGSVSGNAGDIRGASSELNKLADRAKQAGNTDLFSLLSGAAGALTGAAGPVALALAGTQIIRSLISHFSRAGGASYTTYEGTMQLEGSIEFQADHGLYTMVLEEAPPRPFGLDVLTGRTRVPASNALDIPYFHKRYPGQRLGLLALARPPRVTLYETRGTSNMGAGGSTPFALAYSIEPLVFEINPDSGVEFVSVEEQVVVEAPFDNRAPPCPATAAVVEISPVDVRACSFFRSTFAPVQPQARIPLVARGVHYHASQRSGPYWLDRVFVRVSLVLRKSGTGEMMSCLLTFRADADRTSDRDQRVMYYGCSA